jgi:hypothetical protein
MQLVLGIDIMSIDTVNACVFLFVKQWSAAFGTQQTDGTVRYIKSGFLGSNAPNILVRSYVKCCPALLP